MNTPVTPATSTPTKSKRKQILTVLAIVSALGLAYGGYHWYGERATEETDNAYVQGNLIQITPQVSGTVTAILADDTDYVKAGQALVQLDTADAKVALDTAEANLAQAVRQVRNLYANNDTLAAQVSVRETDIARAQTEIARASDDLKRREALASKGAVSQEELNHAKSQLLAAQNALAAAQAGVVNAKEQLSSNQSLTSGTHVDNHPSVLAAAAKVREAYLNLHRATLQAPADGYVAKRTVQIGQRVQAGAPLMNVIPLQQLWVDANFKEVQLRSIRIGQPVLLTADLYGKRMEYHGKVAGMGMGTGAAFSLLPAQNATGNWIKVVQRVPVRVELDPAELAQHPLRIGLSMDAKVDVADQSGKMLADAPSSSPVAQTTIFTALEDQANAEVKRVIAQNAGARP
ncbi:efflux RND transporter periplasmic adaptor subunit [Curvibacter sp. CHRR-16]|uniref:HlyD family secretion protein n=1 Tax=Curvibacter sp. CHRR-16 TaxID=2835872 RepID=UPI001BDA1F55|nr:efflux RND transporter periplasmic adaptor subunit [Curvibacter sp. CHRR-16]MBT0568931.1 efflux RND transporter periplasmic adaptor subunit [Curvibacter sp. CHRR-16]